METSEILKKVRQIEIKTRGLSNNIFAGQYHSAFKGRGMSFSEVREYQFGDDIRDIDWNVTARFNKPYVKVFEEERELTVMLMVDVSGSLAFGSPRASINLALAARTYAFIKRRGYVIPEDVRAVAHDVLRHRIGLTYEAEANSMTSDEIISKILNKVEVP